MRTASANSWTRLGTWKGDYRDLGKSRSGKILTVRITSKGQVTIPIELRERAGLLPGTEVEFAVARRRRRATRAKGAAVSGSHDRRTDARPRDERPLDRRDHAAHPRVSRSGRAVLVDSNVLLDVLTEDPQWGAWSSEQLAAAADLGHVALNPIVYAEVSIGFERIEELDEALPADDFLRLPLPWAAAFLAGKCFLAYRRAGGERRSPLPDFYIGAHAAVEGMPLLHPRSGPLPHLPSAAGPDRPRRRLSDRPFRPIRSLRCPSVSSSPRSRFSCRRLWRMRAVP